MLTLFIATVLIFIDLFLCFLLLLFTASLAVFLLSILHCLFMNRFMAVTVFP